MKSRIYVILTCIYLIGITYASSYDCNSCADCTAKIASSAPGDTITLSSDITASDSCINVSGKSGFVFDCAGRAITGTGQYGRGVQMGYGGNATIRNCLIRSFYYGVYVHDSENNTIKSNTAENNNVGIYCSNAPRSNAQANIITESVYGGIFIGTGSEYSNAAENEISSSSVYSYGIEVYMSNTSTVSSNVIRAKQYGIRITSSSYVLANANTACGHTIQDVFAYLSSGNAGDSNTCDKSSGWNDAGVTGCKYPCQGTSTTTTGPASSSSTTTTSGTTTTLIPGALTCASCRECREKINSANLGSTVYLTSNITTSLDTCVETIGKTGVTFDCQNHGIRSSNGTATYGVYLESSPSMTIKNCMISGFNMGILVYSGSNYTAIYKNTVENSLTEGVSVFLSNHVSVTENTVGHMPATSLAAIGIINSNQSIVMKNRVNNNRETGILLYYSMNGTVSDNSLGGNGYGINITEGSAYNSFSRNTVENNTYGISIATSGKHNTLKNNYACYNSKYDLYHDGANNSGTDNTCSKSRGWSDANYSGCSNRCPSLPFKECQQTFGGAQDDVGRKVIETSDGGYAIIGTTSSCGAGGDDVFFIKTNENCAMEWNMTYGGAEDDSAYSIRQTSDYGYIIAGTTRSYGAGGSDLWLLKTSEGGTMEWSKTYGGKYSEKGYDVLELADGFLVLGTEELDSNIGAGNINLWIIKTDRSGAKLWNNSLGGDLTEYGFSLSRTLEGGYVIAGAMRSSGYGGFDAWKIKLSPDLAIEKENHYGSTENDYAYSCFQTNDGGYAIGGSTDSYGARGYDALLIKTNNKGETTWNKRYGGTEDDYCYSMIRASDGGYILAGSTRSFAAGEDDFWIVKTDSSGNMKGQLPIGGEGNETAYSVIETYDGAYVMVGSTDSYGSGGDDVFLVKTISPEATTTTTTTTTTTSTSSTTTTLGGPCEKPGDYPPCGDITLAEVINYINAWARGEAELGEVIDLINAWASD
ncbi:MAG: right-handed parallel beta-helix repeat-containing protein [Candidatus Altiarchaeia archaeon]